AACRARTFAVHQASGQAKARQNGAGSVWLGVWRRGFAGWPTWPGMVVLQVGTTPPGMAVRYLQTTSGFPAGRKG
ncbi:TPA: hypothetical protein ACK1Z8_003477, partial [Klebsiella michiganensis]